MMSNIVRRMVLATVVSMTVADALTSRATRPVITDAQQRYESKYERYDPQTKRGSASSRAGRRQPTTSRHEHRQNARAADRNWPGMLPAHGCRMPSEDTDSTTQPGRRTWRQIKFVFWLLVIRGLCGGG
jgi:hypothetical protein